MHNTDGAPPSALIWAEKSHSLTKEKDFFVGANELSQLVSYIISIPGKPEVSLNRPQYGRSGFVHRVVYSGFRFISVTARPFQLTCLPRASR